MKRAVAVAFLASLHSLTVAASLANENEVPPEEVALQEGEDACEAGATADACSLSLRQLRGEVRTASVSRHLDLAKFEADVQRNDSTMCAANPKCYDLGMTTGWCCPTPDNTMLGCCESASIGTTTPAPANGTACSEFEACTALGITEGACCPTADGTMLGCCSSTPTPPNVTILKPQPNSECSKYSSCVAANLTQGYCCPTVTGHVLDCCGTLQAEGAPADEAEEPAATAPAPAPAVAPPAPAPEVAPPAAAVAPLAPAVAPPVPEIVEDSSESGFPPAPPPLAPVPRPGPLAYQPPPSPTAWSPAPTVPPPAPVPQPPASSPCYVPTLAAIGFVNCGACVCVHYTSCPVCGR